MMVVIDANIVISSLIAGTITDLIFSPKIELSSPELLFTEIKRHLPEIKQRSRLSETELDLLLALLEHRIHSVPMDEFIARIPEAERLLGSHMKDAPYIALALHLGCPFWSYEKRFKQQKKVEVLTTKDLIKQLRS